MSYSQFTINQVKQDFHLTTVEGVRFFPDELVVRQPRFCLLRLTRRVGDTETRGKDLPTNLKLTDH
ncbi:hypothetical protein [Lusitaniella coriacea]|uniref:hypothetical protein n=1 Tax=Lusitaniella coriacea TaxID=1983105 RepID=UPI003CEA910E